MIPTKEIDGGFLVPAVDSHIGAWARSSRRLDHDQWLLPQLEQYIPIGGTVVDAGAYIGDHSKFYSDRVGEDGRVIAFEPNPDIYEILGHNSQMFEHHNVCVLNRGLAHRIITVTGNSDGKNLGADYFVEDAAGEVRLHPLDTEYRDQIHFIKMDIEGWEFYALIGAMQVIDAWRPVMLLEMNESAMARTKASYSMIFSFLDLRGYRYHSIQNIGLTAPQYDLLCLPK